jgi:hypothetical protein
VRDGSDEFPCHADHIVSTMAIAEELGVIALGALWWDGAYRNSTTKKRAAEEIVRQGAFLASAWDADKQELLMGIGDQANKDGELLTYSDFAEAQRALAIGPPGEDNVTQTTVQPQCSYASPDKPAADVAAHTAAALALGSMAVKNFTGSQDQAAGWLEAAEGMLQWSLDLVKTKKLEVVSEIKDVKKGGNQDFAVLCPFCVKPSILQPFSHLKNGMLSI